MDPYYFSVAGISLSFCPNFSGTPGYFDRFRTAPPGEAVARIPQDAWDFWLTLGKPVNAFGEFSLLSLTVSDALLGRHRCLLHGAAFSWAGRAWAVCAPPGVGKSSLLRVLNHRHPDRCAVICGDRPALELGQDRTVLCHPSPWNGKENWYGAPAAPLAGLILLERGEKNRLSALPPKEAVIPMLESLICSRETEDLICACAAFEAALLERVPVWRLTDHDLDGTADCLYETLLKEGTTR